MFSGRRFSRCAISRMVRPSSRRRRTPSRLNAGRPSAAERHVLADRPRGDEPFLAAVGRDVDDAAVEHPVWRGVGDGVAVDRDRAAGDWLQTEDGAADLRLAGADEPRQTDDLTGAHVDRDVMDAAAG